MEFGARMNTELAQQLFSIELKPFIDSNYRTFPGRGTGSLL
jgi:hypothetical protein